MSHFVWMAKMEIKMDTETIRFLMEVIKLTDRIRILHFQCTNMFNLALPNFDYNSEFKSNRHVYHINYSTKLHHSVWGRGSKCLFLSLPLKSVTWLPWNRLSGSVVSRTCQLLRLQLIKILLVAFDVRTFWN